MRIWRKDGPRAFFVTNAKHKLDYCSNDWEARVFLSSPEDGSTLTSRPLSGS